LAEVSQNGILYKLHHFDPWVGTGLKRVNRSNTVMNSRSSLAPIHSQITDILNHQEDGKLEQNVKGDICLYRELAMVEWTRPLNNFWVTTWGLMMGRVKCVHGCRKPILRDPNNISVTSSGKIEDWALVSSVRISYNGVVVGNLASISFEKVVEPPRCIGLKFMGPSFLRLRCHGGLWEKVGFGAIHVSVLGGLIFGEFPPYEAFTIGGAKSVRGYDEGGVGVGRRCAVVTGEFHWSMIKKITGSVFMDFGTDIYSTHIVAVHRKPGKGWGIGSGIRMDTPLGLLRLEYAMSDRGQKKFHFGLGME